MSILWYKDMAAWEASWLNNGAWSPERVECARLLLEAGAPLLGTDRWDTPPHFSAFRLGYEPQNR